MLLNSSRAVLRRPRVRRALLLMAILALSALLGSCLGSSPQPPLCDAMATPEYPSGLASDVSGGRESSTKTYCFRVDEKATLITVSVAVSISDGSVEWSLLDPLGTDRWSDEVSGFSGSASSDQFKGLPGVWRLRVEASGMRGGYNVTWTAMP